MFVLCRQYLRPLVYYDACRYLKLDIQLLIGIIAVLSLWVRWCIKSPASRLFTQPFIKAQIKENIKVPLHWPLWGEFTGDLWIHRTKGQ